MVGGIVFAASTLQLFVLASCGYRVYGTSELPFSSVRIGLVENRTFEPGLQDLFAALFAEELLRRGVSPSEASDFVVSAVLTDYKLDTLSIKDDLSSEYSIQIVADVTFRFPDGTTRDLKGVTSEFMETFVSAENVQAIQAQREAATERAMRGLCQRIISEMTWRAGE